VQTPGSATPTPGPGRRTDRLLLPRLARDA
jgi:hypothetical protein